jgi:hypothetical protein
MARAYKKRVPEFIWAVSGSVAFSSPRVFSYSPFARYSCLRPRTAVASPCLKQRDFNLWNSQNDILLEVPSWLWPCRLPKSRNAGRPPGTYVRKQNQFHRPKRRGFGGIVLEVSLRCVLSKRPSSFIMTHMPAMMLGNKILVTRSPFFHCIWVHLALF